jgi:hypothetical protein
MEIITNNLAGPSILKPVRLEWEDLHREVASELDKCSKDQRDLIMVFWKLGKPFASNGDIYAEYRKHHPCDADPVKHRENRIRNVLQRNCETSKRFKDGDGRKIFRTEKRGFWELTPEYLAAVSSSSP